MVKPIIAFDLDGTIISSTAAENAHAAWFTVMGNLVGNPGLKGPGADEDYFPAVLDAMEKLTGLSRQDSFEKQVMVKYARNLYQMLYLAELRREGERAFVPEVVDMIIDLKKRCRIALITTSPEDMVLPALDIGKIKKLFDYIYRGPLNQEPSKLSMLRKFIRDVGKPALYIGNEKGDAEACKELGVKFALAKWGKHHEAAGVIANYNITSPKQLKGIVDLL